MMPHTFAQQLRAFALAVDIVSSSVMDEVLRIVTDYVRGQLDFHFFEVLLAEEIGRERNVPGLRSKWTRGGKGWSSPLRDENGKYKGHVSYAMDKRTDLWIVSESDAPLDEVAAYRNLLPPHVLGADFPAFEDLTGKKTRTSIMLRMVVRQEMIGLINLESEKLLKPTGTLLREVRLLAETISDLYTLNVATETQGTNTLEALRKLHDMKKTPLSHRRRLFFASAEHAAKEVIAIVEKVAKSLDVELISWRENFRAGKIQEQIWKEISSAHYGVCCLSEEPKSKGPTRFRDNSNVLFEAGIMYALTHSTRVMRGWIPIREADSPDAPFDFRDERIISVPRMKNGRLSAAAFEKELRNHLSDLISSDHVDA